MKKIYVIKETCPLWNDGTGEDYERILPYVFLDEKSSQSMYNRFRNDSL